LPAWITSCLNGSSKNRTEPASRKSRGVDILGIEHGPFTPPSCETVFLSFLSNGRMSSLPNLMFFGNSADKDYQEYLYMLSTKTQFCGMKTHMLIIHLLKYLSDKYLLNFHMADEGHYWETGDEKLLEDTFKRYTDILNSVSDAFETFPVKTGETMEEYLSRLFDHVNKKRLI
jgi:hypothetical protein